MDLRKAEQRVDKTELFTNIGVLLAGVFAGLYAYATKKEPKPESIVAASIGLELGNRIQADQLIEQVTRCADYLEVLADRKTEEIDDNIKQVLKRLDDRERDDRRR
jgi:hypothetical protein